MEPTFWRELGARELTSMLRMHFGEEGVEWWRGPYFCEAPDSLSIGGHLQGLG